MARKREWGTGSIVKESRGLAIRWSETVLQKDGTRRRKMKYEFLGPVSRQKAKQMLANRITESRRRAVVVDDPVKAPTFAEHAKRWEADILPMYRYSVRVSYSNILKNHLVPRFGAWLVSLIGPKDVQSWVTELREPREIPSLTKEGRLRHSKPYAPHSIHHYQEVLRVVMNEAVTWYGLPRNPALGVRLPKLENKNPTFALTPEQAGKLLHSIRSLKVRTMVALAIVTSLRRGELLALRWGRIDFVQATIDIQEASYHGRLGPPKTDAGKRVNELDSWTLGLLLAWRRDAKKTGADDFVFGTRKGKIDNPSNILRRHVYPACDALKIRRVNFLALRRTFSTMAHEKGIPAKTIAAIMGHANVDTQFIYVQGPSDGMKRVTAERIGNNLSRFCTDEQQLALTLVH